MPQKGAARGRGERGRGVPAVDDMFNCCEADSLDDDTYIVGEITVIRASNCQSPSVRVCLSEILVEVENDVLN